MISILRPNFLTLRGTYRENGNTITMQMACAPALLTQVPPSLTLSVSRKLFRRRLETASLELHIGKQPHIAIDFLFPTIFGLRSLESPPPGNSIPPSTSGLNIGTTHKSFGLRFESIVPKLVGEWGVTFSELALQLKLGVEFGLSGIQYLFSGSWSNGVTQISASTHLNPMGIVMELELVDSFHCQDKMLSHTPSQRYAYGTADNYSHCDVVGVRRCFGFLDYGCPFDHFVSRLSVYRQTSPSPEAPSVCCFTYKLTCQIYLLYMFPPTAPFVLPGKH